MANDTDTIPNSKRSETADTGATIQIEHAADRAAIIHVTYPDDRRRTGATVLKIACPALCLLPPIAWLTFGEGSAFVASVVVAIGLITSLLRQFSAVSRSYVLRADPAGLTIESSNDRRHTTRRLPRNQITDITLGFGYYRGPNSLFRPWLVIKTPSPHRNIRCLHNLGGDHLAPIANTLRAALDMPNRSWP